MTEEVNASLDKHIGNDSTSSLSNDQQSKEELSPAVTTKADVQQSKGSSSLIFGDQNSGAEVAATEREKASETDSPKETSIGKPSLEEIFGTLTTRSDFSRAASRDACIVVESIENELHTPGTHEFIGNRKAVQDLLARYTDSLLNFNFEEADVFRAALRSLVADDVSAEADELLFFARKTKREEMYLQSVAIFDTAAVIYAKLKDPEEDLQNIQLCIQGMKSAVKKMINDDANTKVIARAHVLPLMRNWVHEIRNTSQVSDKWRCHVETWVRYHIGLSEKRVDQWEESKQTLEETVSEMRRVFGDDAHNQHGRLFGTILNELGENCKRESRFEEATAFFEESIKAHKAGLDYFGDDVDRRRHIKTIEASLQSISREK